MLTALCQPACSLLCTPRPVCWCIACAVLCRVEGLHLDCSPHSLFRALSQPLETSKFPRESCHGLVLELQELKHPPGPTTLTLSFWLSPELLFTAQLTSVHTDHTVPPLRATHPPLLRPSTFSLQAWVPLGELITTQSAGWAPPRGSDSVGLACSPRIFICNKLLV